MNTDKTAMKTFEFIGGQMCLDFANTLGGLRSGVTQEYVSDYNDLVAWSQQAGLITENQATNLLHEARLCPDEAAAVLVSTRLFREAIYRIFAAVARGTQPTRADLALLNAELGKAMTKGRIVPIGDGFGWEWPGAPHALDQMFGPIARSAAALLVSSERHQVRECTSATCSWLFVDRTKNHRRRWCTTTGCGNVAKVRRHRQRQRRNEAARPS